MHVPQGFSLGTAASACAWTLASVYGHVSLYVSPAMSRPGGNPEELGQENGGPLFTPMCVRGLLEDSREVGAS